MAGRALLPVARVMRDVTANLDLARRQQRVTVSLLAKRANLSVSTTRALLNDGKGSFENSLRIARILGLLGSTVAGSDPLNTSEGRLRADDDTSKRARIK